MINNIDKLFSKRTVALIRKVHTCMNGLATIETEGIKVRTMEGYGSYYDSLTDTIWIGEHNDPVYIVIAIVHEFAHARKYRSKQPLCGRGTQYKNRWVQSELVKEAKCKIDEIPVIEELMKLKHELKKLKLKLNPEDRVWRNRYRRGGLGAVVRALAKTLSSTTYVPYTEHYGNEFELYQKDHAKRCGAKAKSCKRGVNHAENLARANKYQDRKDRELARTNDAYIEFETYRRTP